MRNARLFIDMDGTIATWQYGTPFEALFEKGYFRNLPPYSNVLAALNMIRTTHNIEMYILSAYFENSRYALLEKNEWLDEHFPIAKDHRIFIPTGCSKTAAVVKATGYFSRTDFLLDDYSENLHGWQNQNGVGIKLLNGGNGTNGTWNGFKVDRSQMPEDIATDICACIEKSLNSYLEG